MRDMKNAPKKQGLPFEVIEFRGREARKYADGSIRDDKGHMLTALPGTEDKAITSQNAPALALRRQELKRAAVRAAANAAVLSGTLRRDYGDLAFIAEITQNLMSIATTPENVKAVDAARWLTTEAGMAERSGEDNTGTINHVYTVDDNTRALLLAIAKAQAGQVIDAIPMRTIIDGDSE